MARMGIVRRSYLINSRLLRSRIPTSVTLLKPHVVPPIKDKLKGRQSAQNQYFDARANWGLPPVNVGDHVKCYCTSGNERVHRMNRRHFL